MSDHVRLMFSDISGSYDLGNDVLSLGMHRLWKKRFVRETGPRRGDRILDMATGTGDIALLFSEAVGSEGEVVGADFSAEMIDQARKREKNDRPNLRFEVGDVMRLRFPDNAFDIATISFGIRNVDDPVAGLAEMRRVVRRGGVVGVLEFGQPQGAFGALYGFYSRYILPVVGGLISGNQDAYQYLDKTKATFPAGERFIAMMHEAGLHNVRTRKLLGGVAWIYIGMVE